MKDLNYHIVFREEPEGGYTAVVRSLPGCVTYGRTLKEAQKMTKDAIKIYLTSLQKHEKSIP